MTRTKTLACMFTPLALLAVPFAVSRNAHVAASAHPAHQTVNHSTHSSYRHKAVDGVLQTVDGVMWDSIPARPSVAWVVGLTKRPGWVLSGDPLGLQLSQLHYTALLGTRHSALATQTYTISTTSSRRDFNASEWLVEPGYQLEPTAPSVLFFWDQSDHGQPTRQNVRNVSLSIDGTQLSGQYFEVPLHVFDGRDPNGSARTGRTVDIDYGAVHIRFSTETLSQGDFMSVLGHLTGARAHPDLVAHLQAELNAAPPSTPH